MFTTKFYLDLRGKAKDGKGSIVILLCNNRTTTTISTGIRISPSEWDGARVINSYRSTPLNNELNKKKSDIDRRLSLLAFDEEFDSLTAAQIKSKLSDKPTVSVHPTVAYAFDEYIRNTMLKQGTVDIYNLCLKKIVMFSGEVTKLSDIDLRWLMKFDKFLSKTQGTNGRSMYMRCLRAVCNYAYRTGMVTSYPFKYFSIKQEETKKRAVTVQQLHEFMVYPVNARQQVFRDYFFLMFYLVGINAKDLLLAKKSAVSNGRFEYIREKTNKRYSIRIEPEAELLIEKYKGNKYLLEAMDRFSSHKTFVHQMNDSLQTIGEVRWEMVPDQEDLFAQPKLEKKIFPLIPDITTYYARHTWATFAYEIGIPFDVISQALGHSIGNRTTAIYVKFDQRKVDEANRRVIDHLLESGN